MKILVAEDDVVILKMLEHSLTKWGYPVATAHNGLEAWNLYQTEEFSLVVTDWMMPELDGFELCKRIRAASKNFYTYIIFLTSLNSKANLALGLEAGADDYISKPFEAIELHARISAGERLLTLERSLARSNELMKHELQNAAKALESLLPVRRDISKGVTADWYFKPSIYIGGDIFNIWNLDDRHVGFYMLDVSGHGVSSALLAVTLSNVLRPSIENGGLLRYLDHEERPMVTSPKEVAKRLNSRFPFDMETGMYFTFFYAVVDKQTLEMRWVGAGHPPALIVSGNEVYAIEGQNPPIGIIEDHEFIEQSIQLKSNDTVLVFSDGLVEARNEWEETFSEERLKLAILDNMPLKASETVGGIVSAFQSFTGDLRPEDDISLLGVSIEKE